MKKRISVLLLVVILVFAGCGNRTNTEEPLPEEESSSEVETPEISEEEEEEEPEVSPVDFDFMVEDEVNGEAIIHHARELGLLESTWNEPSEIKIEDLMNAYQLMVEKENELVELEEDSPSFIVRYSEEEMTDAIATFVEFPMDTLKEAEQYQIDEGDEVGHYEFEVQLKQKREEDSAETTEETEEQWMIQAGEVTKLSEHIYEIVLLDATDEAAPIPYGILTVENNENVPKYISFVKEIVEDETPAPIAPPPVNNPEPPATPSTPDPTPPATSGTDDSFGSGDDGWGDLVFPGDPNEDTTYVNPENPDIVWTT